MSILPDNALTKLIETIEKKNHHLYELISADRFAIRSFLKYIEENGKEFSKQWAISQVDTDEKELFECAYMFRKYIDLENHDGRMINVLQRAQQKAYEEFANLVLEELNT